MRDFPIRTILAVTDPAARDTVAVQRALHLAATHGAEIDFMKEGDFGQLVARATGADLVVLPHGRERSTAAFFRGQPVARLLRLCRTPVLVAREMRNPNYARILVGVDFTPASEALVRVAAQLDPQAELELFHALSTLNEARLRSAEATEAAVRRYRERCLEHAQERMVALTDSFAARRNRFLATIGRGDPGTQAVVQQQNSDADLVVVGKKTASAWGDFLCGSVAHRLLSWGSSDVLVVPQAFIEATAPIASRRIRAGLAQPALAWPATRGGVS